MERCPPYSFAGATNPWWDRNLDGVFTISDVWLIAKWLLNAPGDFTVQLMIELWPQGAIFLELDCTSGGGVFSLIVSVIVWLFILSVFATILNLN